MSAVTDNMQARAAALLAVKYADPWLKISRYEVFTDDLLKRLDDAEARSVMTTMVVIAESDRRAILIALDELEAYVSVIGDEDEAHERQVWAVKKLRILVQSLDAQ